MWLRGVDGLVSCERDEMVEMGSVEILNGESG